MTTRTYCVLNQSAAGAGLYVDEGGTTLTTNENALDLDRAALGNLGVSSSGVHSFEVYVWSKSRDDLAGMVSVGIAEIDHALDVSVGGDAKGYGLRPADGELWNNGAYIETFDAFPERACIGVQLDLDADELHFFLNGSEMDFSPVSVASGKTWVPALSIGCPEAGDVSIVINTGQSRFDGFSANTPGWFVETQGILSMYLSLAREGFLSSDTDDPANQPFSPRILNPESFSIRRSPKWWVQSGGGSSPESSAYGVLRLDNSDGELDALLDMDVRDATLVLQDIDAPAFGAGTLSSARTIMTACIDSVSSPQVGIVEMRLRDTLARLNKPLPCRVIPPFADESSRGRIYPVGLGAQRNVKPLLIDVPPDTGQPIYALGDAPMSNVTLVADGGATLDPLGNPPQWYAAMNGAGIQLDTSPVFRLSADCSTVGDQYTIPGAGDVLNGDGEFENWTDGVPDGWSLPTNPPFNAIIVAGGSVAQDTTYTTSALRITSYIPLQTSLSSAYMGFPLLLDSTPLEPGRTYRITFRMWHTLGTPDKYGIEGYGICLLSKYVRDKRYWITPYLEPIRNPEYGEQKFTFTYTVPPTESGNLGLFLLCASGKNVQGTPPTATGCTAVIDDLRVQLLGQYVALPLDGMTLTEAFREILVKRAGEPEGIFSAADTQAIDDETGIKIGARWTEAPTITDALQQIADTFGAALYTDKNNVIRVRRFRDSENRTPVATFKTGTVRVEPDDAPYLTTSFATRRNWEPFTPGDFVTDTATVSPTQRETWSTQSQVHWTTSTRPSSEYSFAIGAPWFHMLCDEEAPARAIAEEIVGFYAPSRSLAGLNATMPQTMRSGKRKQATFTMFYEGNEVGTDYVIDPADIGYGDPIEVELPVGTTRTMRAKMMTVVAWEFFPFAGKVNITGNYR